jgi:hypothetical protein
LTSFLALRSRICALLLVFGFFSVFGSWFIWVFPLIVVLSVVPVHRCTVRNRARGYAENVGFFPDTNLKCKRRHFPNEAARARIRPESIELRGSYEVRDREDAFASTRDACATPSARGRRRFFRSAGRREAGRTSDRAGE